MYDVLIIGAGAAGLTAAMYSARKKLKTLVVTVEVGGQTNFTASIENFPGIEKAPGIQLTQTLLKQATGFGAELANGKVSKVEKNSSGFSVQTKDGQKFESKAVILAFGKVPRTLGIPGEDKFFGKGVSSCVTCDGPLWHVPRNRLHDGLLFRQKSGGTERKGRSRNDRQVV
ncbi:FAD-dependent oxidoreductase [Candidatus Micrarchaeota archaeon]|nr:FAD-dependent oxidoreductase [Candidatus Micrarchaeota archaeon]